MQRIFAAIALIAIFVGGFWYYTQTKAGQNPEKVFEKASHLGSFDKAMTYVTDKVNTWEPDPEDPEIRVPKNWGKFEVTIEGKTFAVYSPDMNVPPRYYVSFEFPKTLAKEVAAIRCWGTAADKTTDVCIVGNDPKVEAYFQILKLFSAPDFSTIAPKIEPKQ